MIKIDGSLMEGGGQILRMAMDFSTLLKKPIQIFNIRANRTKPGLKAQHLSGMQLVRDISNGELKGASLHSTQVEFNPLCSPKGGDYQADTKTAGAVTLLAQVALPCLISSNQKWQLDLKGGTNADMAPQIDYFSHIFIPNLRRFGPNIECILNRKGYFPKGGGHIQIKMNKTDNLGFNSVELLNSGHIEKITIFSSVAGCLPLKVADEMADAAKRTLENKLKNKSFAIEINSFKEPNAFGNGSSIFIKAQTSTGCILGGSSIGSQKVSSQKTGENAAFDLLTSLKSGACVDQWMQDQMIIYMAMAKGKSRIRTGDLTLHTKTAIHISESLSNAKFNVIEKTDENSKYFIIESNGIGFEFEN